MSDMSSDLLARVLSLEAENALLREALIIVSDWRLPSVNFRNGVGQTSIITYESAYGSNGARDYMRAIAKRALG